ncbi:MAG: sulfur carrier protein ThiS [Planctomycetes bacterium]|nr:sulfur carrier protein ThiS [Planctomycetota bacterium]
MKIVYNGERRQVDEELSVAGLLNELGLDPRQLAVEVNLQLVPRDRHAECPLHEGDRVEVVTLVGGG